MKNGLLLINLGTPDKPERSAIRRYLAEFLADKRVINLSAPLRYLLLYGFILPFRPQRSAHAYQHIWTDFGSPLLMHSQNFVEKLQLSLGNSWKVALGMRYGTPNLEAAIKSLKDCEKITVLPLFPQYSSAATGSAIAKTLKILSTQDIIPPINLIRDFHQDEGFIAALAEKIKPFVIDHDYILFSYHGIPKSHLLKNECKILCTSACVHHSFAYKACYRAQCSRTTQRLASILNLSPQQYGMSFQSRLGRTPWITPYTDQCIDELAKRGVHRLAIACPSFVADCLETLEEIGIRARDQWKRLGGEQLSLVPCLNDSDAWVEAAKSLIHRE
jgi:ferrochelatase